MKSKLFKAFLTMLSVVLIVGCSVVFVSCNKLERKYKSNISEARYNYFYGEVGGYKMSFTSGVRESDFKLDGYHTENVEFGVLTIITPNEVEFVDDATFKIDYDNKTINGILEQNPFDLSLMADIGFVIQEVDNIKITFKMGDIEKLVELRDVTKIFNYNYDSAFDVFIENCKEELKQFVVDNEFQAEVYIKIMHDDTVDSGYYFLVRVVGRSGKILSAIINPISGEMLAKTNSNL